MVPQDSAKEVLAQRSCREWPLWSSETVLPLEPRAARQQHGERTRPFERRCGAISHNETLG
jgi:hypothetical protein